MLFRRIFISMISGTPGTTRRVLGRQYSRTDGSSRTLAEVCRSTGACACGQPCQGR
jgi:hypothetical protein